MFEFFKFWGRCAVDGWEIGDGIINFIGIIALLVSGFLLLRKRHKTRKKWEELAMKITFWIFIATFLLSTAFVAPFLQYEDAKNKLDNSETGKIIKWQPPELWKGMNQVLITFGSSQQIYDAKLITNGEVTFDFSDQHLFKIHISENRVYTDIDIPTLSRPIQIRRGEISGLPENWDVNSNSNSVEIVNDKNFPVFQEFYQFPCSITIKGAVRYGEHIFWTMRQGKINNGDDYYSIQPGGGYSPEDDLELPQIFEYPSSKYPGKLFGK